jgi:hypothetical protein
MRGVLNEQQYKAESEVVRSTLKKAPDPHWKEFLSKWRV